MAHLTRFDATMREGPDGGLKVLGKMMRILGCFSALDRSLSLTEICQRTGLPKSTTHRLVASMRAVGLLDQGRERDLYRLGLKLFEFGNVVLTNMELHREGRPFVEALSRVSGQAVHLAVFDGYQAIVVHRAESSPEAGFAPTLIEAAPTHCTSVGKAILAFQPDEVIDRIVAGGLQAYTENTITDAQRLRDELARIRARGYAVDEGEHQPGLRCIGAPIRDQSGRVFAGISVSGPSWRLPATEIDGMAKIVLHHANALSTNLGYRPNAVRAEA